MKVAENTTYVLLQNVGIFQIDYLDVPLAAPLDIFKDLSCASISKSLRPVV